MRVELLLPIWLWCAAPASAVQEARPEESGFHVAFQDDEVTTLSETIITATRSPQAGLEVPYSSEWVSAETIEERAYRTTPQILRDLPGVMVQETAPGHGSPYIRGFTSFRNLFLIDGIRLNNSVFRPGPNQYWNTVDPLSIEALEVIKGPSSVLYGSDAMGGTVQALTKSPYRRAGSDSGVAGELYYRYGSAEDAHFARAEASVFAGDDFGVLIGIGGKDFGDLEGGRNTGTQPETGYSEIDADLKLESQLDEDTQLVFGFQHVYQNDVPRTHRTVYAVPFEGTTVGSDLRRDLDQERTLAYGQLHGEVDSDWMDHYDVSLSWQGQSEVRHRTRGSGVREEQGFDVGTIGLWTSMMSTTSIGRLTYGFDYYHDDVDSFSSTEPIQGPVADDSTYDLAGIYIQDEIEATDRLDFILGTRFSYAEADAESVLDPVTSTQTSIEDDWNAWTSSARFSYEVERDQTHFFGGISQGFRAPNLSDLTRLDSARTNEFEIPSPGLDPEYTTSYELGVKTERDDVSAQFAVFYTEIEDQIIRFPTGNTNGSGEAEITKDNVGDGYVYGVELGAAWELVKQWTLFGNGTYQYGRVDTYPTSAQVKEKEYITRMMPFMAQLGIRWDSANRKKWGEFLARYAADADKLNTRDQGDTSRIPPGGTPSYLVLDLRGGWRIDDSFTVNAGLANLTDEDYRVHGSGHNMPGRGVYVGVTFSF